MVSQSKTIVVGCKEKAFAEQALNKLLEGYEWEAVYIFDKADIDKAEPHRGLPWLYFTLPVETYELMIERFGRASTLDQVKEYLNGNKDWASTGKFASGPCGDS